MRQEAEPEPEVRLGGVIQPEDRLTQRMVSLGRGMFATQWTPDEGTLFNERRCIRCHIEPAVGGVRPQSTPTVMMRWDTGSISGTSNARRFRWVGGKPVAEAVTDTVVRRKSQPLFGIGQLELIPDSALLALADPTDKDGNGISGRMPKVSDGWGRFGWKSSFATLDGFVRDAYRVELGMDLYDEKLGPDRTLDQNQLDATTLFLRYLKQPPTVPRKGRGAELFAQLNCGSCHTPEHVTGKNAKFPELSGRTIRPYTDLLLHEMGDGPLHGEGKIAPQEVRTPPLWGIGYMSGPYLHDESATTLDQAIRGHGGEASASKSAYEKLPEGEQAALVKFIESL